MAPLGDVTGYSTQPWHREGQRGKQSPGADRRNSALLPALGGSGLATPLGEGEGQLPHLLPISAHCQAEAAPSQGRHESHTEVTAPVHMRPLRPRSKEQGKGTTA